MNNPDELRRREDELHRRKCFARYVLAMEDDYREVFYQGMVKQSGKVAVNQLIDDVNAMRRENKKKKKESQLCLSV